MSMQPFLTPGAKAVGRVRSLLGRVEKRARQEGCTLISAPSDLVEDLNDAVSQIANIYHFGAVPGLLAQLDPQFWLDSLVVHQWALRDMLSLQRSPQSYERSALLKKGVLLVCVMPRLLFAAHVLFSRNKLSKRLLEAMICSDVMTCYAAVFASFENNIPAADLADLMGMAGHILVVLSQIGIATSGKGRGQEYFAVVDLPDGDPLPTLYKAWIHELSSRDVLEHVAQGCLRLEASARAAVAERPSTVRVLNGEVNRLKVFFGNIVACATHPHVSQPIMCLCPRPVCRPNGDYDPTIRRTLRQLRQLLSGTGVQFWLAKELLELRLQLNSGEGNSHGLPQAVLLPRQLQGSYGQARYAIAAFLYQFLNICTTTWQITISGPLPPTPQTALKRESAPEALLPVSLPTSVPFKAHNVFDLAHETVEVIGQHSARLEAENLINPNAFINVMRMLIRLVSELEARHAESRMMPLWRTITQLTPVLLGRNMQVTQTYCRLVLTLAQVVLPSDSPGQGDPGRCSASVRGALDGGFVAALEGQFRRLVVQPGGSAHCLALAGIILRVSGVWPAFMAHGQTPQIASLIVTLRKVATAMVDGQQSQDTARPLQIHLVSSGLINWHACMGALLEQVVAVALQPGSGRGAGGQQNAGGGARQARGAAGGGASGSGGAAAAGTKRKQLALNNAIETSSANHITVQWLAYVGGKPPVGTDACRRQQLLTSLMLGQWLPVLQRFAPTGYWWCGELGTTVVRCMLAATLQCVLARCALDAAPPNHPDAAWQFEEWHDFVLHRLDVRLWMRDVLVAQEPMVRDWPEFIPGVLDVLEVMVVSLPDVWGRWVKLAASSPDKAKAGKGKGKATSSGAAATGSASGVGVTYGPDGFTMTDAFLLRYGRKNLRAAVAELNARAAAEGSAVGSSGGGVSSPAVDALLQELVAKHDLWRLPVLQPPQAVERIAAESWGLRQCSNAKCNTLAGPQEIQVPWKRCGRCKAVFYCSVDCQQEHWDPVHKAACKKVAG